MRAQINAEIDRRCEIDRALWEHMLRSSAVDEAVWGAPRAAIRDREAFIAHVSGLIAAEDGRPPTPGTLLRELEGNAKSMVGQFPWPDADEPDLGARIARLDASWRDRICRAFVEDIGRPDEAARAILERGQTADEVEWRLLRRFADDASGILFTGAEAARADAMSFAFEGARGSESRAKCGR